MGIRQVATRLTCFAVISAIETDLRHNISSIARTANVTDLFPIDVRKRAQARYTEDYKTEVLSADTTTDSDLLDYTDFGDLAKSIYYLLPDVAAHDTDYYRQIASKLEAMVPVRNRVCHSRPLEVKDWSETLDFANDLISDYKHIDWTLTKDTVARLKENPSFVLHQEIPDFWMCGVNQVPNNLPLPEFDDTGFLGRKDDRRNLRKLIAGDHPVVSVVGEGGIGKTALALRCLYDLVEVTEEPQFDAVIWVSLKAKALTRNGARDIEDAIVGTLGLYSNIADELGVPDSCQLSTSELVSEILAYMREFRVLLVVDNLETLSTDDDLRALLSSVPRQSKVVLTSRVGLGEFELRYKLEGMDKASATALMRQYASILNVESLYRAEEGRLHKFCSLLFYNPLLIKWFVAGLAAGGDPNTILNKKSDSFASALKFCFENLFERLADIERQILWIVASARRPLNRAELHYLLRDYEQDEVQWGLNTLYRSSMLKIANPKKESSNASTTDYVLTEIAQEYVSHCAPPPRGLFSKVQSSLRDISQAIQSHAVMQAVYKYDVNSVHTSNREQRICAVLLKQAIEVKKRGDLEQARKLVNDAKTILPTFAESYRISGWIEVDDPYTATNEYLAAIEYDPESPIAYYAYAVFLTRIMEDYEEAIRQMENALRLDPHDPTLKTHKALCQFRLGYCQEAAATYEELLSSLDTRPKKWRMPTWDQAAECYRRWAEQDFSLQDHAQCLSHLNRALSIIEEAFSRGDSDVSLGYRLARIVSDALRYSNLTGDSAFSESVATIALKQFDSIKSSDALNESIGKYKSRFGENGELGGDATRVLIHRYNSYTRVSVCVKPITLVGTETGSENARSGIVARIAKAGTFGFIVDPDSKEWFFHKDQIVNPLDNLESLVGHRVYFKAGRNQEGECAISVVIDMEV